MEKPYYLYQHSSLLFGHLIGGLYPSGGGIRHSFLSNTGGQCRSMKVSRCKPYFFHFCTYKYKLDYVDLHDVISLDMKIAEAPGKYPWICARSVILVFTAAFLEFNRFKLERGNRRIPR